MLFVKVSRSHPWLRGEYCRLLLGDILLCSVDGYEYAVTGLLRGVLRQTNVMYSVVDGAHEGQRAGRGIHPPEIFFLPRYLP